MTIVVRIEVVLGALNVSAEGGLLRCRDCSVASPRSCLHRCTSREGSWHCTLETCAVHSRLNYASVSKQLNRWLQIAVRVFDCMALGPSFLQGAQVTERKRRVLNRCSKSGSRHPGLLRTWYEEQTNPQSSPGPPDAPWNTCILRNVFFTVWCFS